MGFIRKFWLEILATIGILSLYFFLRLINITGLPIFTDEAIYIRWSQIALHDASWRFISLTDGKQPLFTWVAMILMKFIYDPLLAGRMVSVLGGLGSVIALWFVTYELFKNKWTAYISSLVYVCFPFAQVYNRMALYDSLSGAFTLWALYFSIVLVRRIRLDVAYTLGFAIGLGALNKSTNFFSMYLLPVTLLLFDFSKKGRVGRLIKWGILALVAVVIAQGMYAILRLSPLFHMVTEKNALFIYPFSEWKNHPFDFFIGDLLGMTHWLWEYLKLPYIALIIFSFRSKVFLKEKVLLFLFFLLPFLALALFARILFPRFIFFMTLSLLPLVAVGLADVVTLSFKLLKKQHGSGILKTVQTATILAILLFYPLYVAYTFATDPVNAAIANPDRAQYVNHWTAGWGVKESVEYLKDEALNNKIYIGTEGTFGLLPFALEMYLVDNPNITIKGFWPVENNLPQELVAASKKMPTYMIFYQPNNITPPEPEHLELIQKTQEGKSKYYYRLYKVFGYK